MPDQLAMIIHTLGWMHLISMEDLHRIAQYQRTSLMAMLKIWWLMYVQQGFVISDAFPILNNYCNIANKAHSKQGMPPQNNFNYRHEQMVVWGKHN